MSTLTFWKSFIYMLLLYVSLYFTKYTIGKAVSQDKIHVKKEYLQRKYSKKGGCQAKYNLTWHYYEKVLINLLASWLWLLLSYGVSICKRNV